MSKRAVNNAKRMDDRRRSGLGDNSPFTARAGVGGLGAGKRISSIVSPTIALHQFTNRVASSIKNGKGKKTI